MNVSPTRVTIDARYLRTQHSGIGRYTEKIIEHLLEIAPHLSLHLLTHPERPAPFEEHARVRHTVFDAQANSIATRAKLAKLVHDTSPDLYHSPFNFLPAKLAPELPNSSLQQATGEGSCPAGMVQKSELETKHYSGKWYFSMTYNLIAVSCGHDFFTDAII